MSPVGGAFRAKRRLFFGAFFELTDSGRKCIGGILGAENAIGGILGAENAIGGGKNRPQCFELTDPVLLYGVTAL